MVCYKPLFYTNRKIRRYAKKHKISEIEAFNILYDANFTEDDFRNGKNYTTDCITNKNKNSTECDFNSNEL